MDGNYGWGMGWRERANRQIYCDSDWLPETTLIYNKEGDVLKNSEGKEFNIYNKDDMNSAFEDLDQFPPKLFEPATDRTSKL